MFEKPLLAFIRILLLSFIFILFVYILGANIVDLTIQSILDLDSYTTQNKYLMYLSGTQHSPLGNGLGTGILAVQNGKDNRLIQIWTSVDDGRVYHRIRKRVGIWLDWHEIAFDLPTFYKNYADLSSLASAIGGFNIGFTLKPLQAEKTLLFTVETAKPFVLVIQDLGLSGVAFGLGYSSEPKVSVAVDLNSNLQRMLSIEGYNVYITPENTRPSFRYKWFYL